MIMDACSCYQDYNTRYQTTHSADRFILQTVQTPESDNKPPLLLELGRISKMSPKKPRFCSPSKMAWIWPDFIGIKLCSVMIPI